MDNPTRSPIRPVQNMIVIAFVIALAAVATTGILAWSQYQDFTKSLTEVESPKQYLKEFNALIAQLLEAEGSLRSYALTGNKEDLKAQRVGMENYTARLAYLKEIAEGNEFLLLSTDTIESYFTEKYQIIEDLASEAYVPTGESVWRALFTLVDSTEDVQAEEGRNSRKKSSDELDSEQIKLLALKLGKRAEEVAPLANWSRETWIRNMNRLRNVGFIRADEEEALAKLIEKDRELTGKIIAIASNVQQRTRMTNLNQANDLENTIKKNGELFGLFALLVVVFCLLLLWNIFRSLERNRQLQLQLEEEKARAEKLAAAKEEFLANMSHEIRTPMNAVIGFAEQLAGTRLNSQQKDMLNPIRQSANYLLALINDVLDYSKLDAGAFRLEQSNFRIQPVIEEVITTFAHVANKKGLRLQHRHMSKAALPEIFLGDPLRLRQMLFNLVGNAVKFTDKGSIEVRTFFTPKKDKEGGSLRIDVRDTGIGIPPDRIDSVFSDFEQADTSTTRKYGGTGLGLPITKRLAEVHGGKVDIQSAVGKGTTVSLELPYAIGTQIEEESIEHKGTPSNLSSLRGLKVLLADDEPYNQQLIQVIMDKWQIELDAVSNGKEVIQKLKGGNTYDLILMDLQMPEMDGMESSRYIREKLKLDIPILAMTATSTEKEIADAQKAGMNAHLLKPFQEVELLALLAHWLKVSDEELQKQGSALESYDLKTLYQLSNQDRQMVLKMLQLFQKRSLSHIEDLQRALKKGDYAALGARAHQMIPSCRHLGLDFLVEQLTKLELDVKSGNALEASDMAHRVGLICSEIEVVRGQIEKDIRKLESEMKG